MAIFTGAGVALATPFKENGDVNFEKLEELIDFQVENGTDAIIIMGTTGEASTLSHEEQKRKFRLLQEQGQTVQKQQFTFQKKLSNMGQTDY